MERVIRETAEQETLYDHPEEDRSKVRVSGPFSVEAIPVATMTDADVAPAAAANGEGGAARDWLSFLLDQLRKTGVHFKTAKGTSHLPLAAVRPLKTAFEYLHAEAGTGIAGDDRRVALSFGPKNGPVTPFQVRDAIQQTRGFDLVLFVGFACDPEALRMIETGVWGRELHFVHAAPDILVGDLLKTQKATKLFTVFGSPDVQVSKPDKAGLVTVSLTGVDLYDPVTGETTASKGDDVAAWFLDQDYDDRTFCICQAFFPAAKTKNPWEKLQKALKGSIDEEKFEALRGTTSLPFKPGRRIAVKVVDDRGNEVMKVVEVVK